MSFTTKSVATKPHGICTDQANGEVGVTPSGTSDDIPSDRHVVLTKLAESGVSVIGACRSHASWVLKDTIALGEASCHEQEVLDRLLLETTCGGGLTRGGAWALRGVQDKSREVLNRVRAENADAKSLSNFIEKTRELPSDGHGDWYGCKELTGEIDDRSLTSFLDLAQRHPDDERAQITACKALSRAVLVPPHLDGSKENLARFSIAINQGLALVVAAMRAHMGCHLLQERGCEALWRVSEASAGGRAAKAAGVAEVVCGAMLRYPTGETLQQVSVAVLTNVVKHRRDDALGAYLEESVGAVASAMNNYPKNVEIQSRACAFLWHLAQVLPDVVGGHSGLRGLVEHAATCDVRQARLLLDAVQWRRAPEFHASRMVGRQRWGQWAVGRHAPA